MNSPQFITNHISLLRSVHFKSVDVNAVYAANIQKKTDSFTPFTIFSTRKYNSILIFH